MRQGTFWPLVAAAVVTLAEALLVGVLAVLVGVDAVTGRVANVPASAFMTGLGVLVFVALLLVGRGLVRRRRWARSPALVTQIIAIPVAVALSQAGQYAYGIPLGIVAVLTAAALLSPPTTKALFPGTAQSASTQDSDAR